MTPTAVVSLSSQLRPAFFVTLRQIPITGIGDGLNAILFLFGIAAAAAVAAHTVLSRFGRQPLVSALPAAVSAAPPALPASELAPQIVDRQKTPAEGGYVAEALLIRID